MHSISHNKKAFSRRDIIFIFLLLMHVSVWLYYLYGYLSGNSINFIIAIGGLPLIIFGSVTNKRSYRFIILSVLVACLSIFLPQKPFLFLALIFSCVGLIEIFYGKISLIPLLIVLVISPISYFITITSFPIRIWLTKVAASIMNLMGHTATAAGNVITFDGADYSVDPACTGLKMLTTSLWFCLYLLYFIQKRQQKYLRLPMILAGLLLVLLLNIVTNITRIVMLVYFNIMPDNVFHELVGISCFVLYTVAPVIFLFNKLVQHFGHKTTPNVQNSISTGKVSIRFALSFAILVLIAISGNKISTRNTLTPKHLLPEIAGYSCDMYDSNVVRVKSDESLIYVKGINSFYSSEHNPLMCWVGSGYEFKQLKKVEHGTVTMYTGVLANNNDVLHTAWWYDNGYSRTISQVDWRWDMLKGAQNYSVVNITCNTYKELNKEISKVLDKGVLNNLLRE